MKKHYLWILFAGAISAAVFKDLCFGPILGVMIGGIIGIPLYILADFVLRLFIRKNNKRTEIIARYLTIGIIVISFSFLFQPPGWLVFMVKLACPIPPSVKHIDAAWRTGLFDVPVFIKFEISREDLDKIISNNKYEKDIPDEYEMEKIHQNKLFDITNINDTEVYQIESGGYVDETLDYYIYEYIIYDPNTKQAFYSYCLWS
ncbi:MAG: hypothetical protein OEV87_06130 [Phycisphaerae bacterium]|nr:hypothetical protein [Phycisphaerae bacterium]